MNFLLLVLACLVSAAEEPLPFSGKFNTIYLASQSVSITAENSPERLLMREVNFFQEYNVMSMTFYVRKNGKCEQHTVWARAVRKQHCILYRRLLKVECTKKNGTDSIPGLWRLRDAVRHFPNMYFHPATAGGLYRTPSEFYILIHIATNTTILFEARVFVQSGNSLKIIGALATGTNINEEMWEEYKKLTQKFEIPTENIKNVYETDACPKWKP